jgi:hypothetical protein
MWMARKNHEALGRLPNDELQKHYLHPGSPSLRSPISLCVRRALTTMLSLQEKKRRKIRNSLMRKIYITLPFVAQLVNCSFYAVASFLLGPCLTARTAIQLLILKAT